MVASRHPEVEMPSPDDLYTVGVLGVVARMIRVPDGTLRVLIQGSQRIRIGGFHLKCAGEAARRVGLHPAPTEDGVGRARRAKIQSADRPRSRIAVEIRLQILQRPPAQRDLLGAERDLRRDRCERCRGDQSTQCR